MKMFLDALRGILLAFRTEKNLKIHLIFAILVVVLAFLLRCSLMEWTILLLCIGGVITAELFNSAVEKLCDFIHPEHHKTIGLIKDISAGAVLWFVFISVIIGLLIFVPKILIFVP